MTNRTFRPHRAFAALLLAVAFVAAGCSGSDSSSGTDDDPTESSDLANPDNCPVGAQSSADGKVEVTVWHAYNALTKTTLEESAAAYNSSQDKVTVRVEAQGTYPELLKKYEASLASPQDLPDVIFSEDTALQFMVDSGTVIPAADCIAADPGSAEFYDALLPVAENAYTVNDKLWASAFGASMPVMYVNNGHLEAAGLSTDDYPETLAEVREVAEKIQAANIAGLEAPVVMQLYGWYPENWITGARQEIVNERNGRDGLATESLFDNEVATEVVEWLDQMHADGLLKAYPYDGSIDQFLAVGNETSSILIDGSRAITAVDAVVAGASGGQADLDGVEGIGDLEVTGIDVSVAPVPGIDKAGQGTIWGSAAFLVAGADDAKVAGGWDFLQFFNSVPQQVQWTLKGSYLPVTTTAQNAPEIAEYFSSSRAGQWLATVNQQLTDADPDFPGPAIGPYNEFRDGIHTMLESVVLGSTEPQAGIDKFNESFQAALDRYAAEIG